MATILRRASMRVLQLLALPLVLAHGPALAATFEVNSTLDVVDAVRGDGVCETAPGNAVCTLRAAIQETNTLPGADVIILPAGLYAITRPGTISGSDTNGSLDIRDSLELTGVGSAETVVDGGALDSVFASVGSGKTIRLSGLTIQNGSVSAFRQGGGGILATGNNDLTLVDVVVRDNHAGDAGGIFNQGNLTLIRTDVRNNTAILTAPDSREFRQGGGIFHRDGTLTIRESTIRDNTAVTGGGIYNLGTAVIEASTVSGNVATNVMFSGGDGGAGIVNGGALAGTLTITNSTISGNRANGHYGGIYNAHGHVILSSTTIADNVADADGNGSGIGGGIGLGIASVATAALRNTVIANNRAAGTAPDCASPIAAALASAGHNLIGNAGTATECALTSGLGDQIGTSANAMEPGLMPLADNGGPTLTHALMDSSPLMDAGDPSGCTDGSDVLANDQRGLPRAAASAGDTVRCDVGAYEADRPMADAGADQRVNTGATVMLDGTASTAGAGVASFAWTQVAGDSVVLSGADTATPSFTAPSAGDSLVFQLTVTDAFGATDTDTVTVAVNVAPVANAGPDQDVAGGTAVTLNGTASTDTDGTIASYSWTQVTGAAVTLSNADSAASAFTAPSTDETLVFRLTVTDNEGATHSDEVSVTVAAPIPPPPTNQPPVADAGPDRRKHSRSLVILNGLRSYDPDGKIVRYRWVQTGGPAVPMFGGSWPRMAIVTPKHAAVLTFELTVTDGKGATGTDSVSVTVDDCKRPWYTRLFSWRYKHGCR